LVKYKLWLELGENPRANESSNIIDQIHCDNLMALLLDLST